MLFYIPKCYSECPYTGDVLKEYISLIRLIVWKKKNLKEMHSEHSIILGNGEAEQTIMNNE